MSSLSPSPSPLLLILLHTLRHTSSHTLPITSLQHLLTRHSLTPIDATKWLQDTHVKHAIVIEKNDIKATKEGLALWSSAHILPHLTTTLQALLSWKPIGHPHDITQQRHSHLLHVIQHHYDIYVRDHHVLDEDGMDHVIESIKHAYAFLHLHQPIPSATSDEKWILEDIVLRELYEYDEIKDSWELLNRYKRDKNEHERLISVLTSLQSDKYIVATLHDSTQLVLTPEGREYEMKGSPEAQVWNGIGKHGAAVSDVEAKLGKLYKIGFNTLMKNKLLEMDKSDPKNPFVKQKGTFTDTVQHQLHKIATGQHVDEKDLGELKKRQLIVQQSHRTYSIVRGANFQRFRKAQLIDLTHDLLSSGAWKTETFKERNWDALAPKLTAGILHPLMKVRAQFRSILLEMGFSEMPTNNFVESSFWNFDALYQPQQHPARDSHDTFFVSQPAKTRYIPEQYCQAVQDIHEKGGFDSIGYRYSWKREEAEKNILRTHTTAVSSRMLKLLADQPVFTPKKYFSIDRVFRNETLDSTHLAEFHQVEGLIADYDLTLGDLMGVIKTFFSRIGIEDIRFKPAYNPYTEPSMEIFGKSKEGKVMEIGNSGVFRPEMLRPMGLPEGVRVIAWGLSLERPTMIKYGIRNIRDLFGHKVKLNIIEKNAIARFDD